jgi:Uma2 family endonuclease
MVATMVLEREKMSPLTGGVVVQFSPAVALSDRDFFAFCQQNPTLLIERNALGEVIFMSPTGGVTGHRNVRLGRYVDEWAEKDGTGVTFDSSTGFVLPNGAIRSPDVAWVKRERLERLTAVDKQRFLPLCPDFVIELQSPTDSGDYLAAKLEEYIANGTQLGWLINPQNQTVTIYRPHQAPETLTKPTHLHGDPEMAGLSLNLHPIWEPAF